MSITEQAKDHFLVSKMRSSRAKNYMINKARKSHIYMCVFEQRPVGGADESEMR
jgi:hypothetical protein